MWVMICFSQEVCALQVLRLVQQCYGITRGRVLNGKLYAQTFQNLICLHLLADCFMKISVQSLEQIQLTIFSTFYMPYMQLFCDGVDEGGGGGGL